ncbi:MAG TPA: rhamnogalacturonan lyase, partial [Glycomyces sp.]|nr:rhamnogalacturonan lyase [Glycomyces sp.]
MRTRIRTRKTRTAALFAGLTASVGLATATALVPAPIGNADEGDADISQGGYRMEALGRGVSVVPTAEGNLVGWRLLGTDAADTAFNVYRDGELLNESPLTGATNFLDASGDGAYTVEAVGAEPEAAEAVFDESGALDIPLDVPSGGDGYTYEANDMSVGDLDGDGRYEYLVKWNPTNAKDNAQAGVTGNVYIDAYTLEGDRLWRIDLGPNIRAGAHYTQFQVYDYDGDGKAEVAMKTADATVDGAGAVIGDANADHRNSSGYILEGPEFLTVFDGATGTAIDTIDYNPPRGNIGDWGDDYGNRADRFLAGTAYLDGETPSMIFARGYYTRSVIWAVDFDGQS